MFGVCVHASSKETTFQKKIWWLTSPQIIGQEEILPLGWSSMHPLPWEVLQFLLCRVVDPIHTHTDLCNYATISYVPIKLLYLPIFWHKHIRSRRLVCMRVQGLFFSIYFKLPNFGIFIIGGKEKLKYVWRSLNMLK